MLRHPSVQLFLAVGLVSCGGPPFPPSADAGGEAPAMPDADAGPAPPTETGPRGGPLVDPTGGKFSLAEATETMAGSNGTLSAEIRTSLGVIRCDLFEDKAPNTVANFIGLARGVRPFKSPSGEWVKKPAYDGTSFHRVIKGFMIQGGDPLGTGLGEPGYVIPDEIWPGSAHDRAGQLCMANRGPNTNGMQFFITDGAVARLDGNYTIFGQCKPTSVVTAIASVPKGAANRPDTAVTIEKISILRYVNLQNGTPDAGR